MSLKQNPFEVLDCHEAAPEGSRAAKKRERAAAHKSKKQAQQPEFHVDLILEDQTAIARRPDGTVITALQYTNVEDAFTEEFKQIMDAAVRWTIQEEMNDNTADFISNSSSRASSDAGTITPTPTSPPINTNGNGNINNRQQQQQQQHQRQPPSRNRAIPGNTTTTNTVATTNSRAPRPTTPTTTTTAAARPLSPQTTTNNNNNHYQVVEHEADWFAAMTLQDSENEAYARAQLEEQNAIFEHEHQRQQLDADYAFQIQSVYDDAWQDLYNAQQQLQEQQLQHGDVYDYDDLGYGSSNIASTSSYNKNQGWAGAVKRKPTTTVAGVLPSREWPDLPPTTVGGLGLGSSCSPHASWRFEAPTRRQVELAAKAKKLSGSIRVLSTTSNNRNYNDRQRQQYNDDGVDDQGNVSPRTLAAIAALDNNQHQDQEVPLEQSGYKPYIDDEMYELSRKFGTAAGGSPVHHRVSNTVDSQRLILDNSIMSSTGGGNGGQGLQRYSQLTTEVTLRLAEEQAEREAAASKSLQQRPSSASPSKLKAMMDRTAAANAARYNGAMSPTSVDSESNNGSSIEGGSGSGSIEQTTGTSFEARRKNIDDRLQYSVQDIKRFMRDLFSRGWIWLKGRGGGHFVVERVLEDLGKKQMLTLPCTPSSQKTIHYTLARLHQLDKEVLKWRRNQELGLPLDAE